MKNTYHRGEELFLYVSFKDDKNQPINNITDAMVSIFYEHEGMLKTLLDSQELIKISDNEYCYSFLINDDAPYTLYQIEYSGLYNGISATTNEEFHIISNSERYDDAVKVFGYVHESMTGYPLIGVSIEVESQDNSKIVSSAYTREDGLWELYLYPGEYSFTFKKFGFVEQSVGVQLGAEYTEIKFDNVALESEAFLRKGSGIYRVSDKYITKEGVSLNGLKVKAINSFLIAEPDYIAPEDITNDKGEWELFLDPGMYILKVNGNSLDKDFDLIFRLKVRENGEFSFEDLSNNIAVPENENDQIFPPGEEKGTGSKAVSDVVTDFKGNPIVDVQVCVYEKSNKHKMIAQDYTSPGGKWEVYLDPGKTYIFEFYHPEFHEFNEERTIE